MGTKQKIILVIVIVVGLILLIAGWYMNGYNRLVRMDESVKSDWAQVETQLQRRYDLIPNLVNTVKGYAAHESGVLTAVTEARSRVGSATSVPDKISANRELGSALSRLLVVAENYPQLKANENFLDLQAQLEGTENRIAVARRNYNEAVREYNVTIRNFLQRFIAGNMGLAPKPFFENDAAAAKAPEVKF
ncbi:MAG: LemA family protein [Chitinivibrionales bacterium]|nr:LemA family protein [Chitinivibrionales bacterium]